MKPQLPTFREEKVPKCPSGVYTIQAPPSAARGPREVCAPAAEDTRRNGRVRACTQPHTCGGPWVLNFVLFSAAEMPFDKFGCFIRSNEAIHPIFPPPPKECILLFESSSGTKQKVYNLPWLPTACSIRSTPAQGI